MKFVKLGDILHHYRKKTRRCYNHRTSKQVRTLDKYLKLWGDISVYDDDEFRQHMCEYLADRYSQPLSLVQERMRDFQRWKLNVKLPEKVK
jgi:hypothetical protein